MAKVQGLGVGKVRSRVGKYAAHLKTPARFSALSGDVNGLSVSESCNTLYAFSGLGFRVYAFENLGFCFFLAFGVQGFGFRVSCFRFQVQGLFEPKGFKFYSAYCLKLGFRASSCAAKA